jgi:hypothetical protein
MNGSIHLIDRNIFLRDAAKILSVSGVLIIAKYLITFFFADRDSQLADIIISISNIDILIFCCSLWLAKSYSMAVSFTIFIIIILIELLFLQGTIQENYMDILLILAHRAAAFSAGLLLGFALRED